jgi:hypothetical protein
MAFAGNASAMFFEGLSFAALLFAALFFQSLLVDIDLGHIREFLGNQPMVAGRAGIAGTPDDARPETDLDYFCQIVGFGPARHDDLDLSGFRRVTDFSFCHCRLQNDLLMISKTT